VTFSPHLTAHLVITSTPDVVRSSRIGTLTSFFDVKPFSHRSLVRFSRNLRRQRLRVGFTQERLAEKLDITPRHYQKLEAAVVTPTFGVLVRLRRVLKAKWEDLLGGV